jgi:hypothetical protein
LITPRILATLVVLSLPSAIYAAPESVKSESTLEENCAKIKTLVTSYNKGFGDIRGAQFPNKLMTIWETDFHLVGKGCEIWGWSGGKVDYVCSKTFPTEDSAHARYQDVKRNLQTCLAGWGISQGKTSAGEGMRVEFQNGTALPIITLQSVNTKGLFKSEWTDYIFIGSKLENQ